MHPMRDKLIEIMKYRRHLETSELADVLLENGAIVDVVRCKDCEHYREGCDICMLHFSGVDDDAFCSYGVRKGGEG